MNSSILEEVEKIKEKTQQEKKNSYFGKTPLNIKSALHKINEQCAEQAEKMIDELNEITPKWFSCKIDIKKDKSFEIKSYFDEIEMGNQLIKQYHLIKFPKLSAGAVYDEQHGNWRYFGKDEMKSFTRKETLEELKRWGYFQDMQQIFPVSTYVDTATYDRSYPEDTPFLTSKPELIVFKNGTYNMLTGELRKNDPEDYILNSFDYEIPLEDLPTPKTDKFLQDMFGDGWLFLKQFIGYGFYRSYAPSQEIVFLHGDGGEGKSTFLNFLTKYIFNEKNVANEKVQDLSGNRFSSANLLGKSMNICGEIPKGNMKNSDRLKILTGFDKFMAEYKGIQGFYMRNYAKLLFSANELPGFRDLTGGFSDRLVVIKAINGSQRVKGATFFKDHPMEELIEEAPNFAKSCIKEFMKIFDGYRANFTTGAEMDKAKTEWLYDNDYLGQFIEESCTITPDDDKGTSVNVIMDEYKEFCQIAGVYAEKKSEVDKRLKKLGCTKEKATRSYDEDNIQVWRYMGCRLNISYKSKL